ncbi:hypothetical protein BGX38DRAFT_1138421 [Terfezia claveryi]|nr:hypothetical protein BGX38DRAFT_1138421 [Terfezia claveryi]
MFIKNLFLSTLAVASLVSAQSPKVCQEDSNSINSQADQEKIASCQSLSGDVVIGEDIQNVSFENLQSVGGNFIADNAANLVSITIPKLQTIKGEFRLQKCQSLQTISAPALTRTGKITWIALALTSFNAKISEAQSVTISDTKLTSLDGIDLKNVNRFDVNNNQYLKSVTMNLQTISEALSMGFNAKSIAISFPALIWSNNMTITGAGSFNFPTLQHVNGSMNFLNTSVTSVACKNLTVIEQTLAFIGNDKVTELDFPILTQIGGGFKIHNNSQLVNINGFPKLKQVDGAIDFVGNFKNASLPSLEDVRGGFNLQTTEEFDCSDFSAARDDKVIKGDSFVCKSKEANPTTADGTPGADGKTDNTGTSGGNRNGGAGLVGISAFLGIFITVISFVF